MEAKTNIRGVSDMDVARIYKVLDDISGRLSGIESKLDKVVRLEERVKNHDEVLDRYGLRLDSHGKRLRESELWQANYGDRSSVERLISHVQKDVSTFRKDMHTDLKEIKKDVHAEIEKVNKKIDQLESTKDRIIGKKGVMEPVIKWVFGIVAAVLIWRYTK